MKLAVFTTADVLIIKRHIIAHNDLCGGFCHECIIIDDSTSYVEGVKCWSAQP
jgi:hypothetical protein